MNKRLTSFILVLIIATAAAAVPALSEGTAPFSFRNGITFGMTPDQIVQTEEAANQVQPDSWRDGQIGTWYVASSNQVAVSQYTANLMYFFGENQMEMAAYDFSSGTTEEMYKNLTNAYCTVYGASESVEPAEIVQVMDCFIQGFYTEENISSALAWRQKNVTIYQFYYGPDAFVVLYNLDKFVD